MQSPCALPSTESCNHYSVPVPQQTAQYHSQHSIAFQTQLHSEDMKTHLQWSPKVIQRPI